MFAERKPDYTSSKTASNFNQFERGGNLEFPPLSSVPSNETPYQTSSASVHRINKFNPGRITGPIQALKQVIEDWNISIDILASALGYEKAELSEARGIIDGVKSLRGRDQKDRVKAMLHAHYALRSVFRNPSNEQNWLRSKNNFLSGRTPLSLLENGSMEDILTLRNLTEFTAGR